MKEDPRLLNAQTWDAPMHPQEIFKETQAYKLGDAPVHPLLHQQLSVLPSPRYIFITSCVMCYSWSVSLFTLISLFCFVCCSNKLYPSFLLCGRETHAPLKLEHLIGFACLFLSCELFLFLLLSCWSV